MRRGFHTRTNANLERMQMARRQALRNLAMKFPAALQASQLADLDRVAFHADLIMSHGSAPRYCDIGSGIGMLSLACAERGAQPIIVDDFRDAVNDEFGDSVLDIHRTMGVQVCCADVLHDPLPVEAESLDVVASFECIEHLHHSPKRLLHRMYDALRPRGLFILSLPNCVDLMKRITTPLGRANWTPFDVWYHPETFRGHVREASVGDLRRIAADLGLRQVRIFGRNWAGHAGRMKRTLVRLADPVVRLRPSLCLSIYLVGVK